MSNDQRAFFALEQGTATRSASIVGWAAGRWRLLGTLAMPVSADPEAMIDLLLARFGAASPDLADHLGADARASDRWARLSVRTQRPGRIAVLAATERAVAPLAAIAEAAGWRAEPMALDVDDPLAITRVLLQPDVVAVLAGAGEPPAADERGSLNDLGAIVAAAATRRRELTVVLAGPMSEQVPRFDATGDGRGDVVLASSATTGDPGGEPLRVVLEGMGATEDDGRRAFERAVATLAEVMDRRIEALDVGWAAGTRVVAEPAVAGEASASRRRTIADACFVPAAPDDSLIDRVLEWSTQPLDRHRLRDRLYELALAPWADTAGEGAILRLAVGRAALAALLEATTDLPAASEPDLVVVSGGVWSVAPGPAVALAVSDVLRRPGSRQLAHDHARLLAPLGAIEDETERRRVLLDVSRDILVPLGAVVMPQGLRPGRTAGQLVVHGASGAIELDLVPGSLELIDLPPGETAVAELRFRETVRLGARGRRFAVELAGGLGGLLIDLRDIPLRLPERAERRRELLGAWQEALWAGVGS
ncbi:MAG TPA: hypothetical protein VH813_04285 [Candidatus Limnocylindrales bacterium]